MYSMYEVLARERMRQVRDEVQACRRASDASRARRWQRVERFAARRAARSRGQRAVLAA